MRKNYLAQILSFMLVLCMMAAFVPAAFAADTTEETKTGIKIVYDFDEFASGTALQDITYENSHGRMQFLKESADTYADTVTEEGNAVVNIKAESDAYIAFEVKIPKLGKYRVRATYKYTGTGPKIGINFIKPEDKNDEKRYYNTTRRFVTIDASAAGNAGTPEDSYVTVEGSVDTATNGYAISIIRTGKGDGRQFYLKSIELLEIDPDTVVEGESSSTWVPYENPKTIPMCGDVTASVSTLTGDAPEAELSLENAYMSDGKAATEEDLAAVTYKSSDESIIAIENGKAVAKSAGKATISAYFGDLLLGSTELSAEVSGAKLLYTFDMGVDTMQEISYENSHGRIAWHGTNSKRGQNITSEIYARVNLDTGANLQYYYDAFKIRVPKNTTYNMDVTYLHEAAGGPIVGVWILPANTTDIGTVVYNGGIPKPDVKIDTNSEIEVATEKTVSGSFKSGEEEEYLLVFARTGEGLNRALSIKSVELSSGAIPGPIPFYGKVSFDKSYLENKNDTVTVSIANTYLSDGTEGTFDVTYASSDESVATVSGSTVTAKGAGTATIFAYSGDFAVGSNDIDVAATNEDGTPTTAADGEPEIVSQSVKILTTVLGNEATSSSTPETVSIVGGYATVTADAKDENGNTFLYWAKGLQSGAGKKVLSTVRENYKFKPSNGVNYIIAVYGKPADEYTPKYFNANGQLLSTGVKPTSASMPGYGTTTEFADCGFGIFMADYNEANEASYRIIVNNNTTEEIRYVKYGNEVTVTAETPSEGDNFRFWKKRAKDGEYEIVSFKEDYTFYAFEDCEVTAVYSAYESATSQDTLAENFRKIILTNLGGEQYMAEFIGFEDAVEKGIAIIGEETTQRIAMTTDATQFTLDAETTQGVKGYAIDADGKVYYAD